MTRAALIAPVCLFLGACIIETAPPPPAPPPPRARPAAAAAPAAAPAPPPARPTVPQPAADGRPANVGKEDGTWIWRTGDAHWHVRTTAPTGQHRFAGNVVGKGTEITLATSVRAEKGDKIALTGGKIEFEVTENGGLSGFDFAMANANACVVFDLTMDAEQQPQKILVGSKEAHPQAAHFTSCP